MGTGICTNPDVLSIIRLVNIVILIIQIITPIILIIVLMMDFANAVKSSDNDLLSQAIKKIPRKVAALVIIFLMPTFVNLVVKITDTGNGYSDCLVNAKKEKIDKIYVDNMKQLVTKAVEQKDKDPKKAYTYYYDAYNYISKIKNNDLQKQYEGEIKEVKDYLDDKIDELNVEFNNKQFSNSALGSGSGSVYMSNGEGYAWPVLNSTAKDISDDFGPRKTPYVGMHYGIDIAKGYNCKPQSIIVSSCNGTVSYVSTPFPNQCNAGDSGYGNHVKISCDNNEDTFLYGHLYEINVKSGDKVLKCQKIGIMGSTGYSTGTHLHYGLYERNTNPVDPLTKVSPTNMCE